MIYAIHGEPVRGMAGGSQVHARIIRNAAFALHALVRPPTATGHLRTPAKPKTASSPSNKRGSTPSLTELNLTLFPDEVTAISAVLNRDHYRFK